MSVLKRILLALTSPVWFPVVVVILVLMCLCVALGCAVWGGFMWIKTGQWGEGERLWSKFRNWMGADK